ncbi:mRNA decay activator protein ZFP36L3-like [Phalaenopsis equestris]|uniref:mRNA decay activator protein ZFP36L3-like n=1 Tax=Phalaenopsis equestris TaxID=78828 RepID=UPI0009E1C5E2|nr:mRNA decay activator protein ZFP36L3-like [Phalaenopsis equestris]
MSDSDETIVSLESSGARSDIVKNARRRFSLSSPSPNAFLTPAFTAAASAGGFSSNSPLNIDSSLLRFKQSHLSRLRFSSSSSSSNDSPDSSSSSAAAVAARMQLQQLINPRSLSSSSRRGSVNTPLSSIENLQSLLLSGRSSPAYLNYTTPMKFEIGDDVLVMDATVVSLPMPGRNRQPLERISSSSSSSSVKNNPIDAKFLKTDICCSWEEFGFCRFGSRCQFAHGKQELRGSPPPWKLKPESGREGSAVGSSADGDKYIRPEALDPAPAPPPAVCNSGSKKMKIIKPEREPPVQKPVPAFSWPPTKAEEAEIQKVLYGPGRRGRRLPVFVEVCSDSQ